MAIDPVSGVTIDRDDPGVDGFVITPHDVNELAVLPRAIYVGVSGDITCRSAMGTVDLVFKAVPAGSTLPFAARYIRATGTTATNMIGLI